MAKEQESGDQSSKNGEESQKNPLEHPAFKEEWTINFSTLCISGESATGKSTIADLLGRAYGIPVLKIGQEVRNQGQQRSDGSIDRDIKVDQNVDELQRITIITSTPDDPHIIEGRMSAVIATEEKEKNSQLQVVCIKLDASEETRNTRLAIRENIIKEEAGIKITNRTGSDQKRWEPLHPAIKGTTPYDPKFFDYIVDADKPLYDVFNNLHEYLLYIKAIEPKYKSDQPNVSEQIFPTPNF